MSYLMSLIFLGFTANARIDLVKSLTDTEFTNSLQACLIGYLEAKYGSFEKAKEKFVNLSYYIESNDPEPLQYQIKCLPKVCGKYPKQVRVPTKNYKEAQARNGEDVYITLEKPADCDQVIKGPGSKDTTTAQATKESIEPAPRPSSKQQAPAGFSQ